jgi:putative FmdB family regulatory protein
MPIYGYNCKSCEHSFDALQKISDPKLVDCPECGESSLRKMLSAPKFRLKGKGWYETDFKTGDKRNIAGDTDKSSSTTKTDTDKPAKKVEATTETKTATKTEKSSDTKAKSA